MILNNPVSPHTGLAYKTGGTAGELDMLHLGNRNVTLAFEAVPDGDYLGIQPDWLADTDQSTVFRAMPTDLPSLTSDTSIGLLYKGSHRGAFDMTLHFADGASQTLTPNTVDPRFGFDSLPTSLGPYFGREELDLAELGWPLELQEALITHRSLKEDHGFDIDGRRLTGLTFHNRQGVSAVDIYAMSLLGSFDADDDGLFGACDPCFGDHLTGDADGDSRCANLDCDDMDPTVQTLNVCGLCTEDLSCVLFMDDFESGDLSAWQP